MEQKTQLGVEDLFEHPERARALAAYLNEDVDELEEVGDGPYGYGVSFKYGRWEFAVMTDDEADAAWEESIEYYVDECILPELPEWCQSYFDTERFKRDAKIDGRGHSLATYDGDEHGIVDPVTNSYFVMYRIE